MIGRDELAAKVKQYDAFSDAGIVARAYEYSQRAHAGQMRHSGDPYFIHPLAAAEILIDYRLDASTIAAALLHDTLEDTPVALEDIRRDFGPLVAELVDGVTKLAKINMQRADACQA